jgi:hypothetical protein
MEKERISPLESCASRLPFYSPALYTDEFNTMGWTAFCHRYPCDMFGMAEDKETRGRTHYRSIHPKFARYHEQAGNEAG